jgi:outer membrane lipoprotein SlyB
MKCGKIIIIFFLISFLVSCAAPLKTDTVTFLPPSAYPNFQNINGLQIVAVPIVSEMKLKEIFGTDLKVASILPIHLIVQNNGNDEFEINSQQIFGISQTGEYTVAYNINKAAEHVRSSSIGTTAVTGAVAGAVVGAAAGAAIGAGVGHASGDSSTGAESGAIIGGTMGATSGTAAGLSDSFTIQFKKELANLAFEDQVVFPGDIKQGFVYLKWKNYNKIRVKIFDITSNRTEIREFNISVTR